MQNVPRIVQSRLQRSKPVKLESHPDADLLTVFTEQSLAGRERDRIVEHLARCGDCREVVSIALPPQLELQPSAGSTSNWFRWPVVRWAAVAAGVALIASFGILQYRGQHPKQLASNAFDKNTAIVIPAQIPQASSPPTIPFAGMKEPAAKKDRLAIDNSRPRKNSAADAGVSSEASNDRNGDHLSAQDRPQDQLVQNEPADASVGPGEFVAKAKPASAQSSPSTLAPAPSLHTEPILMRSLVRARWTISATGALQHSLDGGKTWLEVSPAVSESTASSVMRSATIETPPVIFRSVSVSSNAAEVWAGGSGAALYHTVDGGKRWTRVVPAASGTALSGDIVSIQFSDPRNGTVTTSNSEAWITTDDGQTWHKQQ